MMIIWYLKLLAAGALTAFLLAAALQCQQRLRAARYCFGGGFCCCLALFLWQWLRLGEPPFGNMFQVLSFLPLVLPPLYVLEYRHGDRLLLLPFALVGAIALTGVLFMDPDLSWRRAPALQSLWFVPHVASYILSYALAAVAAMVTLTAFRRRERASAAERLSRLAFAFMTFGLVSGALWAEAAWGSYWSWDIKESWSLITRLLYATYFHLRKQPGGRRAANWCNLIAFAALLVTFLVVNLLPKIDSLHSYAQ